MSRPLSGGDIKRGKRKQLFQSYVFRDRRGRDRMVIGFITTYAISA
jgi:hypothetical protein